MSNKINQKLGLKAQTRTRQATHSPSLATNQQCPHCASHHVNQTQSVNGKRLGAFWCAMCSAFFDVAESQAVA